MKTEVLGVKLCFSFLRDFPLFVLQLYNYSFFLQAITVNCARIIRPDNRATNGVIHVIDRVLSPLDVTLGTVVDVIKSDKRFFRFATAIGKIKILKYITSKN